MPAWSVPTTQLTSAPFIRCQRTIVSISVCWNAWPMCSVPVTFGGGSWMHQPEATADRPSPPAGAPSGAWRNSPRDSHSGYQRASIAAGSKLLASAASAAPCGCGAFMGSRNKAGNRRL